MNARLLAGLSAGIICGAVAAHAMPIVGGSELSLNGSDQFTGTVGGSTFTINFTNPANVGGQSISFNEIPNCTGCVTMISTLTQASTNFTLYTLTDPNSVPAGDTSSLTVGNITSFSITSGNGGLESLAVNGTGTLNLTGFDPTPGFFDLTTQGPGGPVQVTFSNTAIAAANEPGTLGILGAALAGMFALLRWGRRRLSFDQFVTT